MYKGTVVSKRDLLGHGIITVCPTGSDESDPTSWISVKYQSFYGGGSYAGSVFIPEGGTEITYDKCENDPNGDWYFVGCIMNPSRDKIQLVHPVPTDKNPALGAPGTYPHDDDDGKYNAQSMSYGIRTPLGHQILMKEGRNEKSDSKGISIESGEGRGLVLDDSSKSKRVNLHSQGNASQLVLTDLRASPGDQATTGPEGATLRAVGNLGLESSEGGIKIRVQDGLNLVISNASTQSHAPAYSATPLSPPSLPFLGKSGNVIIEADKGDISIRNHGNGVFIDCMGAEQEHEEGDPPVNRTGASFQVRSNNKIHLYAQNGIDIKSTGDINMVGANVNIKAFDYVTNAPGNINLNSANDPNLTMGIRKTNDEIDMEIVSPTPLLYFGSGNGWDLNYQPGANTSEYL